MWTLASTLWLHTWPGTPEQEIIQNVPSLHVPKNPWFIVLDNGTYFYVLIAKSMPLKNNQLC